MFGRISAREWNDHVHHLASRYPISARATDAGKPAWSWKVTPVYDADRKRWTALVRPGSVNGKIATTQIPYGRASAEARAYLRAKNPERFYGDTTPADVPLDFGPALDLTWREIGGSANPITVSESGGQIRPNYETVPQYFLERGVPRPGSTAPPPVDSRRLFAGDLVLRQPRTFLSSEITSLPGGPLGGSILSVNPVSATPPDAQEAPRVVCISRYTVPAQYNSFADIFFQRFLDEPFDELHLSTVYALSPPLQAGGSFPAFVNDEFTLETRYYCHYNLAYATRTLPRVVTPPLTLVTGLAAGLGDVLFNLILATQNDFAQSVVDLYNQRSLRGSFWVV